MGDEHKDTWTPETQLLVLTLLAGPAARGISLNPRIVAGVEALAAVVAVILFFRLLWSMFLGSGFLRQFVFEKEVDGVIWKKLVRGANTPFTPRGHCRCGAETEAFEDGRPTICKAGCSLAFPDCTKYNETKWALKSESDRDFPLRGNWHWKPHLLEPVLAISVPILAVFLVVNAVKSVHADGAAAKREKTVRELSILLKRAQVIARQCQGAHLDDLKPGETIQGRYDAWYSDVKDAFPRLGLDSEVYHAKLENTPGTCEYSNPLPCLPKHCRVYCQVSLRKDTLTKIIQEVQSGQALTGL